MKSLPDWNGHPRKRVINDLISLPYCTCKGKWFPLDMMEQDKTIFPPGSVKELALTT